MTSWPAGPTVPLPARADVPSVELDGEIVIYDDRADVLHLLNPTATAIWSCLDGRVTLGELVSELGDAFDGDPAQIRADLTDLLDDLAGRGLLSG